MTTSNRADTCRTPDGSVPGLAVAAAVPAAGTYLTNGAFLYRVIDVTATGAGAMVALEDCYGLDVVRVPLAALRAGRLRVVTPAAAGV